MFCIVPASSQPSSHPHFPPHIHTKKLVLDHSTVLLDSPSIVQNKNKIDLIVHTPLQDNRSSDTCFLDNFNTELNCTSYAFF